ncbi:MAG: histidine phosphatase family protein [Alphaproteobacteria bacterium]|nr:MAG: histidine phosphatase family protein [Alphaproteobacteria bacterium]
MIVGFLRHFPTGWNAAGRIQGRSDPPLSPESRAALARLRLPDPWRGLPVISSPLCRALETACALAAGPVVADPRLVEMDFGAWEGRRAAELLADPASGFRPVEAWGWDFRPPGGESPAEIVPRLVAALAELPGPALIVTHRGVMRCALALATGWGYRGPEPFRIRRAMIHPVTIGPDGRPGGLGRPEPLVAR